jgi:UTP:GlnB (protein PII) uridylyltransferase
MIREIRSRHLNELAHDGGSIDVKEGVGALRDIEMILLIYKAKYGLREPINRKLVRILREVELRHRQDLEVLSASFDFLRSVRDAYRLTVSADNVLRPEYLDRPAKILGFSSPEELLAQYHSCTTQVAGIMERMITDAQA